MRTQNIPEALQMLQQIERDSRDFIAPANMLTMMVRSKEEEEYIPELRINENTQMPMNQWAHNQLAEKLGIPTKYYDRMKAEEPHLLKENVNTWLERNTTGKLLVRTTAGHVRAVLSDRYKPIPNTGTAFTALATLNQIKQTQNVNFTIRECAVSDTMMYLKVTADTVHMMKPGYIHPTNPELNGDPMFPGIMIRNSEVGASRFRADVFLWRLLCSNGAIITSGISKVHLGRKIGGEGEISFSERTEQLDTMTVLSGMNDIIKQVFDPVKMQEIIERVKAGQKVAIDEPVKAVEGICEQWKISDHLKDEILANFTEKTQFGVANAITAVAKAQEDLEDQIKLEEIGGEILVLDEEAFRRAAIRREL